MHQASATAHDSFVKTASRPVLSFGPDAAEKFGMKGVVISRYGKAPDTDLPVISDLDGLIAIVTPGTA